MMAAAFRDFQKRQRQNNVCPAVLKLTIGYYTFLPVTETRSHDAIEHIFPQNYPTADMCGEFDTRSTCRERMQASQM